MGISDQHRGTNSATAGHRDGSTKSQKAPSASPLESLAQHSITLTGISCIPSPGLHGKAAPSSAPSFIFIHSF